jgi:uncharacterized membrane protein YoaK (UPF0700 family)
MRLGAALAFATATSASIIAFAPRGAPLAGSDWRFYVIAALAAISMGIQNTVLLTTRADHGPFTTHITGALTSLVHGVARRARGRGPSHAGGHASLCVGFLAGGLGTMVVFDENPIVASLMPLPILAILLIRSSHREDDGSSVHRR